jgi:hypothetical protein
MPEAHRSQPLDSGDTQLNLFGAGDTQVPVGVRDPASDASREARHSPRPETPPALSPPSNGDAAPPGEAGENTGVAAPEVGRPEECDIPCILSSTLKLTKQDAVLPAQAFRFTLDALYYLVDEIERIRARTVPGRGGAHVHTGASDPAPDETTPEPGGDLGRPSNGCQS